MVSVALRAPAAPGLNVTEMVQVPPIAMVPGHVVDVAVKSVAFVPETLNAVTASATVPILSFTVMICAALTTPTAVDAKVSVEGVTVAAGAPTPVPVRATDCGDAAALSVTVSDVESAPTAVGEKTSVMAQLAPAAIGETQLLVCVKLPAGEIAMLVKVSGSVPGLESVTTLLALDAPTFTDPNASLVGEKAIFATPTPVPERVAVCTLPAVLPALSVTVIDAARAPTTVGSNVTMIEQLAAATTEGVQLLV